MLLRRLGLAAATLVLATACGGGSATPTAAEPSGELTVLAAASLTDAFTTIGDDLEARTPGLRVRFSFAGSQRLATQVLEGAPADVFASADTAQMDVVIDAGAAVGDPVPFAGNRLAIAVEPGNPRGVTGIGDLADPGLAVVLAAEQVPAGRYARELLDEAGVDVRPVSLEADVRAVLSKVALGEADAGLVYASDVVAAGDDVTAVAVPDEAAVAATYPVVALADAPNPSAAAAFVAYLRTDEAQQVLADLGFAPAP